MADIQAVTDESFESEVLKSELPVIVDFWAPWCGPCRMVGPELERVSERHQGKVRVVKLNVDEAPHTAGRYGVMSIPTIALFAGGGMQATVIGAQPADAIEAGLGLAELEVKAQ
ncbi:MAG: thioredoxin [Actinomycetota bacterium]